MSKEDLHYYGSSLPQALRALVRKVLSSCLHSGSVHFVFDGISSQPSFSVVTPFNGNSIDGSLIKISGENVSKRHCKS